MKKISLILVLLCCNILNAQTESEFEKYKREQEAAMKMMASNDSASIANLEKEYQEYIKAEQEAYDNFVKEMSAMWGGDNVVESTNKDWVEYSDDGTSRSKVDFEKGEVTLEIIVTPDESKSEEVIENKVEDKIKELLISRGKTKDYDTPKEKAVPLQETPVLENQVQTPSGETISNNNIEEGVKEIVKETEIVKEEIKKLRSVRKTG